LFCEARAYKEAGAWDEPLCWLNIARPDAIIQFETSTLCDKSGFAVLKSDEEDVQVYVRYPKYRFRPSHADPLHIDLWQAGRNILRGPGSYRYNTEPVWIDYFSSVAAHNTVQFDNLEAMPRLGRFLFGGWLKLDSLPSFVQTPHSQIFHARCRHVSGAIHDRRVILKRGSLVVHDTLAEFKRRAVIRWRLIAGDWRIQNSEVTLNGFRLAVEADYGEPKLRLIEGWESRYYGMKSPLPVLEIETNISGVVSTRIEWLTTH
jgi:hypothetical protein